MKEKLTKILATIGTVLAAIGGIWYLFFKRKSDVNLDNQVVQESLKATEVQIVKNNEQIFIEEATRQDLKKVMEKKQNEKVTDQELVDFFNNRPSTGPKSDNSH